MNSARNATKKWRNRLSPAGRLLLFVVLVLGVVATLLHRRAGRQLDHELDRKRTVVAADSAARVLAAARRHHSDSARALVQARLDTQTVHYSHQQRRDQDLERRYRATSLVLPDVR